MTREQARSTRLAVERLDVLEAPPPRKGCNARDVNRRRCGREVVECRAGPLGYRRLCRTHAELYAAHDRILRRILTLAGQGS